MLRKYFILIILTLQCIITHSQIRFECDVFGVNRTPFDSLLQQEYLAIKADTILAARHAYSTNGNGKALAIICWKEDGKFQFKLFTRKNNEIKSKTELSYWLRQHIIAFFDREIYTMETPIEKDFYIDDSPYSLIVFYTENICWSLGMGSTNHNDMRAIWMKELISLVGL